MTMYDRTAPTDPEVIDRWDGGVGWIAHPDEEAKRASHAVRGDDGVWIVDPIDAPGTGEIVADVGEVAGVAVLSGFHARDAATFARRYNVPVHVPEWVDRVDERIDAPITRFADEFGGFEIRELRPLRSWREGIAYREDDSTLYVPEYLVSIGSYTVADERAAPNFLNRLTSTPDAFDGLDPDRILFGHGAGLFENAAAALEDSLSNARRRFPRALVSTVPSELRAMIGALR